MPRLGYVVSPGFCLLNLASMTVFEVANAAYGRPADPFYELHTLSETGGPVPSSIGLTVDSEPIGDATYDTIVVADGIEAQSASPALSAFLTRAMSTSRRVASHGTGAFLLAHAGILDGRRATTHWPWARDLQSKFPNVKLEDGIFVVDGPVWTSGGAGTGLDLALGMVEEDLGSDTARLVEERLVLYRRRTGSQSQHSVLLELDPRSERIQRVLTHARNNLRSHLSIDQLAKVAHLGVRQFTRAFRAETGQSPAKAIESLRVEAARVMVERGHPSIDDIVRETGFTGYEHMRRAFLRAFGRSPQAVRRNSRLGPHERVFEQNA